MQIRVKLGGDLKRYASGGAAAIESDGPITVLDAISRLGVEEEPDEMLVIVNDEVVPPGERTARGLADGDQLTLMPQLRGG